MSIQEQNQPINEELVSYFKVSLEEKQKSNLTTSNILRDIKAFLQYLNQINQVEINSRAILSYVDILREKHTKLSFITKVSNLRQFINWLDIDDNPFWNFKFNVDFADFDLYDEQELFSKLENTDNQFNYNELVVKTLYELILRVDELIELNLGDYNQANATLKLREKTVKIPSHLNDILKIYHKEFRREQLHQFQGASLQDPLFIKLEARRMNSKNIQDYRINQNEILQILQKYQLKNSHLKRSKIINLLEKSYSLDDIEDAYGVRLSKFYLPFAKDKKYRLLAAYNQYHPRAQMEWSPL